MSVSHLEHSRIFIFVFVFVLILCEQRQESVDEQIILLHLSPAASICSWPPGGLQGALSLSQLEMDGVPPHTHHHTPHDPQCAPASTLRRPISCRPAVKLCTCIIHGAASPRRPQRSPVYTFLPRSSSSLPSAGIKHTGSSHSV